MSETTSAISQSSSPSYRCDVYRAQMGAWQLCQDVKGGTPAIREKRATYLPRFPSETEKQWDARVRMTFVRDYYGQTLSDHVGLVFACEPKLSQDVPPRLVELLENVDGEGTHWEVFSQRALMSALDFGHGAIVTDFPDTRIFSNLGQAKKANVRAYWTFYKADDIVSWRTAVVGGIVTLVQVVFRECVREDDGQFGTKDVERYRVLSQEVMQDSETKLPTGLGAMRWGVWEAVKSGDAVTYVETSSGAIVGPERLPVRPVYGGERLGVFHSEPHLLALADTVIELTQVQSDYANVMHKCNVPTPVFIGRPQTAHDTPIVMGEGIDIPAGGDAKWLEPQGSALEATERRIAELKKELRRLGAFVSESQGTMTATEAGLYARQRSAKLVRAVRSLQDAIEGALADMAAFENVQVSKLNGGSVEFDTSFGASTVDVALLQVYVNAYEKGALPLDALLQALKDGHLSDEFDVEDAALRLLSKQGVPAEQADALRPKGKTINFTMTPQKDAAGNITGVSATSTE